MARELLAGLRHMRLGRILRPLHGGRLHSLLGAHALLLRERWRHPGLGLEGGLHAHL